MTREAIKCLVLSWMLLKLTPTMAGGAPTINYQPQSQAVILYQQAAFGVIACGGAPLSYQWHVDGVPIAGTTNDQVVLAHAQFSDAGLYSVVVASTEGSVVSTNANRTVKRDDMVLIGGVFTTINGVARTKLARPTQLSPTPGFIAWWYCHTDQSAG